jgi:chromosome segregation ATPase
MVVNPFRAIQSILDVRVCECEHRINTLKYLKTKNGDYTKQASALQAENDALNVLCNAESDGLKDLFRKRLDRDDIVNHDIVKDAVQDLESKNTNYASDLENLVSSLQGTVVLNVELQAQVEQVSAANEELVKLNNDYEEKIAELSHVVECLTKSLNDERSMHETEIEEMKKMMEMVGTMSDQFVQLVCWGIKSNRPQHVLQQ